MQIDIPTDVAEKIVIAELSWHFEKGVDYTSRPPHFSYDIDENAEKVLELRKALRTVLEYYGWKPKDYE